MAITLIEAAKLASNEQEAIVIEEYARTSDVLMYLPFDDITGNGIFYNREDILPGIAFRGVNEGYQESTGVINPQSEALKIAGGDLDVDTFIVNTGGASVREVHEMEKVKALSLYWTRNFFKGDSRQDPRVFDGLQVRLTGTQLIPNATSGAGLSLTNLDAAIDQVQDPTHIFMSKSMRRNLTTGLRTFKGGYIEMQVDAYGRQVMTYSGLPLGIVWLDNLGNEILDYTESSPDGTNTNCTSIYVVSFQPMKLTGIQGMAGDKPGINVRDLGELQIKPAYRTRVEWYNAIAVWHGRAACRLSGITNSAVTS